MLGENDFFNYFFHAHTNARHHTQTPGGIKCAPSKLICKHLVCQKEKEKKTKKEKPSKRKKFS